MVEAISSAEDVSDLELIKIKHYSPQSTRSKKYDSGPLGGRGTVSVFEGRS